MFRAALLLIASAAGGAPVLAYAQNSIVPAPPSYAISPGGSPQSPVQQQVMENYRSQLLQTQREMLQQNPSGLGREQIEVGRQLNTYNAVPPPTYTAAPPPSPNRAPLASYSAAPPAVDAAPPATRHAVRHSAPRRKTSERAALR